MTAQRSNYEPIFSCLRWNNFHFSDPWVIECINYFKSINPDISLEALKKEVKQQWLLLNLRDIKVPSLPPDLKSKDEVILSGNYAVQVESMIDSSRSCYSQFQKLLNADPDHIETKEETEKSSRCLTFHITDGVQDLQAMEYQIIKKIKTNDPKLRPGFKMVILGPVECRKGMILLKDENVRICGGEVDALVITNNLKNILIRRLELDPADYSEISCNNAEENEPSQPATNETAEANFEDGFVESLLSQDDDVFFNVPLQPTTQRREPEGNFSEVQNMKDIRNWNEDMFDDLNSVTNYSNTTPPQVGVVTLGEMSVDTELNNSGTSLATQNLMDVDMDAFTEDYNGQQSKLQGSVSKSRKPVQTKLSSFFKNSEYNLNSIHRTIVDSKKPISVSDKPFVYLKHIVSLKLTTPTVFIIKAIILTLKKKLTIEKEEYKLSANITDGSASVDADFSSEILETFLGYSPCEMTVMVKAKQTNSAIAQRVKESFSKTQEKLISLNCLMEIKFFIDGKNPLILSLQEVTSQTLAALKERQLKDL